MAEESTVKLPGTPPYRIETERLVIRCWNPEDAPLLKAAIDVSVDHLSPWMPWAKDEPEPLAAKTERLRGFRSRFDTDEDYIYGIFSRDETEVLGGTGLHKRVGPQAFEIGYWIRADKTNQGLITEVVRALCIAIFKLPNIDRIEIHCDPVNAASAAIPPKCGFTHEATLARRVIDGTGELRDVMVWSLFK